MAVRLAISMRKIDSILRNGLFTGNFKMFAQVQPKCNELGFLSRLGVHMSKNPPQGFDKPFVPKRGKNSSLLPRIMEGGGEDKKGNSGGSGLGGTKKMRILINMSTAGILGVCWVYFKKNYVESDWKGSVENSLVHSTAENAATETDVKKEYHVTLRDWIPYLIIFCSYTYLEEHERFNIIRPKALRIAMFCLDVCMSWVAFNAVSRLAVRVKRGLGGSLS